MALLQRPIISGPIIAPKTGVATPEFAGFLSRLWDRVGGTTGNVAPIDATYITQLPNSTLSNEFALSSLNSGFVKVGSFNGVLSSTNNTLIQTSDLSTTGVLAGTYGDVDNLVSFTVGADGRITNVN